MEFVDLSHAIHHGMVTYKGLPAPLICDYLSRQASKSLYAPGTEFQIGKIEMVANTGTYLDCPFHRYADGKDLSKIELEKLADLDAILIDAQNHQAIDEELFKGENLADKAVLVCTGWSSNWGTDSYFENHPFLTAGAAEYLVSQRVKLVGIDSHNIDDTRGNARPVHSALLKNEILIVEHMAHLQSLKGKKFRFSAVPPKFVGIGTFPVRAFAKIYQ